MTRQEKADKITRLCNAAGCNDIIRKIHYDQFVDREWHPHPPPSWEKWIRKHPVFIAMTEGYGTSERETSVKLFNCATYYDQYCELKEIGLLEETPLDPNISEPVARSNPEFLLSHIAWLKEKGRHAEAKKLEEGKNPF